MRFTVKPNLFRSSAMMMIIIVMSMILEAINDAFGLKIIVSNDVGTGIFQNEVVT
jgi:hypothetical protein